VTWPKYTNVTGYHILPSPNPNPATVVTGGTFTIGDGLQLILDEPLIVNSGTPSVPGIYVGGGVVVTGAGLTVNGKIQTIGGQFNDAVVLSPTSIGEIREARLAGGLTIDGLSTVFLLHNDLSAGLTATGANTQFIDATNNFWGVDTGPEIEALVKHYPDDNNLPTVDYSNWVLTNTIGSNAWLDSDRDGRQDISETGQQDVIVTIYGAGADSLAGTGDDVFLGTRISDATGFWSFRFSSSPSGTYFVQYTLPANRIFSPHHATDDTVDSDADLNFGRGDVFSVPAGSINFNQDVGLMIPGGAQNPVISNMGSAVTYTEAQPAVLLTSTATVSDPDNANFETGTLTVTISANSDSNDRLEIINQGTNPGQIGVSGNVVSYGGTAFGVFSGGSGSAPLFFQFNAAATPAIVQALIRDITFRTLGGTPSTLARTISFVITDGTGGTSTAATKTVNVIGISSNPVVGFSGTVTYTENDFPVLLAPSATVTDSDSLDFNGGKLTLSITANRAPLDRLEIRSEGNSPGQIGISASTVTYAGTSIGTFTGGAGTDLVVTFNINASLTAVQALLRNLTFRVISDNPSTLARTVRVVVTDGDGGTSAPKTVTVNVVATNDPPVIGGGTTTTYAENATPLKIGGTGSVSDIDSADFATGTLTVTISANATSKDRLGILNVGTGAGQIGVSGGNVTYGGIKIGSFTGGVGFTPLVITLTSSAKAASTQALISNITFWTIGDTPSTATRTVDFVLTDGDGGTSNTISSSVHVNATNDDPVVTLSGTINYTENAAATTLAAGATVIDVDSPTFNTGTLTVKTATNATANDRLAIRNDGNGAAQIGVSGGNVFYEGLLIGTVTGGAGSIPLVVTLKFNASIAATQALVRAITFRTLGDNPSTAPRTITFVLTDGNGGTSLTATKTVNVIAVNDAPSVIMSGSFVYTENSVPLLVAGGVTVTDPDSSNFDTGKLTATIAANADANDRLGIRNTGTGAGQIGVSGANVTYSGVVIGTFTAGLGSTPLVITLNSSATVLATQALARAITFSTLGDAPNTAPRTIQFVLTDGDGGTSSAATKTAVVAAVNDAPVLGGISGSVGYVNNAASVALASSATLTDPDSFDFNGGKLTVHIGNGAHTSNQLLIGGLFVINGTTLSRDGIAIGAVTGNGVGTTDLALTFNNQATAGMVQELIRTIRFRTSGTTTSTAQRVITFVVTDGDSGTSATLTKTVNVS
jgi:hypothetical protein